MWRVNGYEGGEPDQAVSRDVVGGMAPMTGDRFSDDMEPHWSVDFWVADTDAAPDKAAALGGKIIPPPTDGPVARPPWPIHRAPSSR